MRKTPFSNGEYYHVYNRGVEKSNIIRDDFDMQRFFQSMVEFNVIEPIGSIYELSFRKDNKLGTPTTKSVKSKLVNIIAYCINPNHYHFILEQVSDRGIEKFIQRIGGGFTRYINEKYDRSGVLFQGKFKSVHVDSNEYLLYLSAYVNLNFIVHSLSSRSTKSSWKEYIGQNTGFAICSTDIILKQYSNTEVYKKDAEHTVKDIAKRRMEDKDFSVLLIE